MNSVARVVVALAFIVFVMALGYHVASSNASEDHKRLTADADQLSSRNDELRDENQRLKSKIVYLRSDPRVIERRVRDDLGMARRDEIVFLLNQEKPSARHRAGYDPSAQETN